MVYGYVRVSSNTQNLARQLEIMKANSIEDGQIFQDKASGKDMERTQLKALLNVLVAGDRVVVADITRLGRNMKDIVMLMDDLDKKGITIVSLKEGVDTSNEMGRMLINLFGVFSQYERECIRERQRQGIELAKREGRMKGRPRVECKGFDSVYEKYEQHIIGLEDCCKLLGCSRATFYRRIKEREHMAELEKKTNNSDDDDNIYVDF